MTVMFTRSEPCCVPWLGHTKVSEMQSHRDTSSSLPHTLLPAGRRKTHSPSLCLIPSCGCLARAQTGSSEEEPLSQLPSSRKARHQGAHMPWGSPEDVSVGDGRRQWCMVGRCINLPWGAKTSSCGSGYPHFMDSRSCIPHIPTIPRETVAKPIGVSKNGTVGNTQKIEFLLLK